MTEYFISAQTFAAPFFSDTIERYVKADTPQAAVNSFREACDHPCGLYAIACYASADAMKKGQKQLALWLCNHEIAKEKAFDETGRCSYLGHGPGKFRVGDTEYDIADPKGGQFVEAR